MLDSVTPFQLEIVAPPEDAKKLDPDEFLKGRPKEDAERKLNQSCVPPLRFLLAVATGGNERSLRQHTRAAKVQKILPLFSKKKRLLCFACWAG